MPLASGSVSRSRPSSRALRAISLAPEVSGKKVGGQGVRGLDEHLLVLEVLGHVQEGADRMGGRVVGGDVRPAEHLAGAFGRARAEPGREHHAL